MNLDGFNSFFSPLGKEYCNYFYFLSVFFFILAVIQVGLFVMKAMQKGSMKELPQLFIYLLYPMLAYFQNRLLFSMCVN